MKAIKLIAMAAVACMALCFTSCKKDGSSTDVSAIQKQLIGTWTGVIKNTMTLNGKEVELSSTDVTVSFAEKTFTKKTGDVPAVAYNYTLNYDNLGGKGYYITAFIGTEEVGSIYFSISGSTLTITGGDGTFVMTFPKTLTKK